MCGACEVIGGKKPVVGGILHQTSDWTISHCYDPTPAGPWLIVQPTEHLTSLPALSARALGELGPLLGDCEEALRTVVPTLHRVYVGAFNEWDDGHYHVHVFAVDRALVARMNPQTPDLMGPGLWALGNRSYDPEAFGPLADKFTRELAARIRRRSA